MACPSQGVMGKTLTFTVRTRAVSGSPVDADSLPTYKVYEASIDTPIISGTMSKLDDDDTTGLYDAQLTITADNDFYLYKSYTIDIRTTIGAVAVAVTYTFIVVGTEDLVASPVVPLGDLSASADYQGSFIQGTGAILLLRITSFDGTPENPIFIKYTISGPQDDSSAESVVETGTPVKLDDGFYSFEWQIPDDQLIGKYQIDWEYIINSNERHEYQYIVVTSDADVPAFYSKRRFAFYTALEQLIQCAQKIPMYYEQAKPTRDNMTYEFTFDKWNQSSGVRIYRNKEIVNSGMEVDYFRGKVTFVNELLYQEIVNADYNFKWWSSDDIALFLENSIQSANIFPPASTYTLDNVPDRYIPMILYGAAKDALRQLMACLQFQQPSMIFGGADGAQKAFSNMETLKKNYESDWEKLAEQKKYGPYPSGRNIITPEMTLPGGRCVSPYTTILCVVHKNPNNLIVYTKSTPNVYTIEEIYNLFKQGNSIEILSHSDLTGNLIFAPVNYIWESGEKDIYEITSTNGHKARTSEEHLFFVNNQYIPVKYMKEGDELITSDYHNIEKSKVKSIRFLGKKEKMYDLEVNGTANLFANGIKCHNSRWFRYLFK